jgi:hypothetical protein
MWRRALIDIAAAYLIVSIIGGSVGDAPGLSGGGHNMALSPTCTRLALGKSSWEL